MTQFTITPTYIDFLNPIYRNPLTGKWTMPILKFNTSYINPIYGEIDPLNEDVNYHKKVIQQFYMRLKEKWLYKEPVFEKLLKYLKVDKKGDEVKVSLISDINKASEQKWDKNMRKYMFRYIEKIFVTKKFVKKVLKEYVKRTNIKWYDLFYNTDTLKDLFAHKLKKNIVRTIYDLENTTK